MREARRHIKGTLLQLLFGTEHHKENSGGERNYVAYTYINEKREFLYNILIRAQERCI